MKYFSCLFFIMTILSIPSMIFYFSGNLRVPNDLKSMITAISLGNIGASKHACDNSESEASGLDFKVTFDLACTYGQLDMIEQFGQASAASYIDCNSIEHTSTSETSGNTEKDIAYYPTDCHINAFTNSEQQFLQSQFATNCKGKLSCQMSFF
jgi:hypothetical protein